MVSIIRVDYFLPTKGCFRSPFLLSGLFWIILLSDDSVVLDQRCVSKFYVLCKDNMKIDPGEVIQSSNLISGILNVFKE